MFGIVAPVARYELISSLILALSVVLHDVRIVRRTKFNLRQLPVDQLHLLYRTPGQKQGN
jgi:hypothetical protein